MGFDEDVADVAFLSAAALADKARRSPELQPFANAGAADLRTRWERVRQAYPEVCPRDMPPDVLQQHFLPQLQHTISRVRAQRTIDHLIAERESVVQNSAPQDSQRALRDIARLRSNACRPASA